MTAVTDALDVLNTNVSALLVNVLATKETFEESEANVVALAAQVAIDTDQVTADRITVAADRVLTEIAAETAASDATALAIGAVLAQTASDVEDAQTASASSITNALAAAASAASISDYSARVQAILKTRGLTDIKSIVFKKAEGWERTVQASYVTETRPTGRFLGDYANATAAWAAAVDGIATVSGDYYWQTTGGSRGLFECTTSNASAQRYRGASNYFPQEAVIVASGTQIYIFDLTDPLLPVFAQIAAGGFTVTAMGYQAGRLAVGNSLGIVVVDFINGSLTRNNTTGLLIGAFSTWKDWASWKTAQTTGYQLPSNTSTALVIHEGYVCVATSGGVSIVKPDGTVVKSSDTNSYSRLAILRGRLYAVRAASSNQIYDYGDISTLGASFTHQNIYSALEFPYLSSTTSSSQITGMVTEEGNLSITNQVGVDQLWPNSASYADSLIARKGTTYATPPMKKPELMLVCSTVTGSVASTNLITNGDFASGTTGWTNGSTGTGSFTVSAGVATLTGVDGSNRGVFSQAIAGDPNLLYKVTFDCTVTSGGANFYADAVGTGGQGVTTSGAKSFYVAGKTTFLVYTALGGCNMTIDNITVTRAAQDHSGKSNHATINGTLTATAHATGGVAMLSGFTVNTNYLLAPNPWASIGSGDGWIGGIFKIAASTVDERIFGIGYYDGVSSLNAALVVSLGAAGLLAAFASNDGGATNVTATSTSTYDDGLVHSFIVQKTSTHYRVEVDGKEVASVAVGAHGTLTFHASAQLFVGRTASGTSVAPNTSVALLGAGKVALTAAESAENHKYLRNLVEGKAALDDIPSNISHNAPTDTLHCVGTTYEQTIRDGRVTVVGSHGVGTSPVIACGPRGEVSYGGSTNLTVSVPERNLHEAPLDLKRVEKTFRYLANGVRTNFPDPTSDAEMLAFDGYSVDSVLLNGIELDVTDDYTIQTAPVTASYAKLTTAPATTSSAGANVIKVRGYKYE